MLVQTNNSVWPYAHVTAQFTSIQYSGVHHVSTGVGVLCLVHGFITPADSSSTSLGIGLSIALKAERGIPDWLWGAVAQWSEHLQLKQEALGSIPSGCPGFFLFQLAYTNVNGMKDLWCSSTVRLLSTQI